MNFIFLITIFVLVPYVYATPLTWRNIAEADMALSIHAKVKVESDGSYTMDVNEKRRILKDAGRENYNVVSWITDDHFEKISSSDIKARTKQGEDTFLIESNQIEQKSLASEAAGLSSRTQTLVAFPQVQKGAELHICYKKTTKPRIPNCFQMDL